MENLLFIAAISIPCAILLGWGFKALPNERWQMLAALPAQPSGDGRWRGVNLTYYGVFTASALLMATILCLVLLGSIGVSLGVMLALTGTLFSFTLPAARWIARRVDGKANGFTVGGACFVGVLIMPWTVALFNLFMKDGRPLPMIPILAAVAIAYAFGEGIGRLACISFGCCYGKALKDCPPWLQRLFGRHYFVFLGKNKKIAYASGLECEKILPIQAVTVTLFVASGLAATGLFLTGHFGFSLALAMTVTQAWRAVSEFFRSDDRGGKKFTAYQTMSLLMIPYILGVLWIVAGGAAPDVDLSLGLQAVWQPGVILALQGLWLAVFLYTGRSAVTGSTIAFHVHHDRI